MPLPKSIKMKPNLLLVICVIFLFANCSPNEEENFKLNGNIKGLKKGTLFLQHIQDSVLVTLDSIVLHGEGTFELKAHLKHPMLCYLYLNKADNNSYNDRVAFFADPGEMKFTTTWDEFESKAKITGGPSQLLYEEYQNMISNFNKRDLELAQLAFGSLDERQKDSLEQLAERNFVSRYRYLLNFGLGHPNSHVTPYVLVADGQGANPIYLDSIYNNLSEEVIESTYGKALKKMLQGSAN